MSYTWTQTIAPNAIWRSIASSSSGQYLFAVGSGGIYISSNSGVIWTQPQSAPTGIYWSGVACSSSGQYVAAVYSVNNSSGGIYTSSNYGSSWTQQPSTLQFSGIASDSTGAKLAGAISNGINGGIYTSSNYGSSWTQVYNNNNLMWFSIASDSTGQYLVAAGQDSSFNSAIFTSTGNWAPLLNSSSLNFIGVASSSSGQYMASVVSNGGVYTSSNYGASFTLQTSAPNKLWTSITSDSTGANLAAVVSNGGIYTSTNYGANWTQTSAPNQPWDTIASDSTGQYLVAGATVVGIYTGTNVPNPPNPPNPITNTNYIVNNSNGETDLVNIFQINPVGSGASILPPPFIYTGDITIDYISGYYILKFNSSGTFLPSASLVSSIFEVIVVGGGGSGGGYQNVSPYSSSGGNGGSVIDAQFSNPSDISSYSVTIGYGGVGALLNSNGNSGADSSFSGNGLSSSITLTAKGGNGGTVGISGNPEGSGWPAGQGACIVSSTNITFSYIFSTPQYSITGGNSNVQNSAPNSWSTSGANGYGTFIPKNHTFLQYFGGGGGGGGSYTGSSFVTVNSGNGGLGGGGNGGYTYGVAPNPYVSVGNGIPGTGGGGGGGGGGSMNTPPSSGSGGTGVVILYFKFPN